MIDAKTLLEIDGQIIDTRCYYDIQIFSSIKTILPILTFKLKDETGTFFSELDFSVGSTVRVYYVEITDDNSGKAMIYPSTKFFIKNLYDGFEINNNNSMGGFIQVNCVQAWELYGDYTPHAYNSQKISDLIKQICKNSMKNAELVVEDANFVTSFDSGSIKYKTGCSDYEFISKKLLPYTIVDSGNSLFYVNKFGEVHLSGFNTLYSAKEKILIAPNLETIEGGTTSLGVILKEKNLMQYANYVSIEANIAANEDTLKQLKQKVYIYDNQNESTKIGTQSPSINTGSDSIKIKQTFTPIKDFIINDINATGVFYKSNHMLEEQIAAARNTLISTNNMLSISVYIASYVPEVNIGDTVFLWIPPREKILDKLNDDGSLVLDTNKKTHWIVGKWLVASEAVVTVEQGLVAVRYTLVSPTFNFDIDSTSLADYKSFYQTR